MADVGRSEFVVFGGLVLLCPIFGNSSRFHLYFATLDIRVQVLLMYMSHPASTVRQQVSQLWEKIVMKHSSIGAVLQQHVMQSLMSVVARYGSVDPTASSSKSEDDWAAMEAALMSLELVLRVILTPVTPNSNALAAPSASTAPALTPSTGKTVGSSINSASSAVGSGSNPSFQSLHTPLHAAAPVHQLATPSSPADRSPKPSPMQGQSRTRNTYAHDDAILMCLHSWCFLDPPSPACTRQCDYG